MTNIIEREKKQGTEEYIAKQFSDKLSNKLKQYFSDIIIKTQAPLQYANIFQYIDDNGIGVNPEYRYYKTDILILENNIPRIVIEVKQKTYTTHDIITYSRKALDHKRLFPHLRYGFLWLESTSDTLTSRYYLNANGFDFEHCITKANEDNYLLEYVKVIKSQIEISQSLEKIIFKQTKDKK